MGRRTRGAEDDRGSCAIAPFTRPARLAFVDAGGKLDQELENSLPATAEVAGFDGPTDATACVRRTTNAAGSCLYGTAGIVRCSYSVQTQTAQFQVYAAASGTKLGDFSLTSPRSVCPASIILTNGACPTLRLSSTVEPAQAVERLRQLGLVGQ